MSHPPATKLPMRHAVGLGRWRLLAMAAIVTAFAFQGSRGIWSPDEGRYTMVAMEMLWHGSLLIPHSHPELPHLTKPPLTYWIIGGSVWLLGANEWAVRLPYALAFAATIFLLYRLGRRLVPDAPWLPAAIYGTSLAPALAASVVTTDTLLALWETLAVASFVESRWCREPRRRRLCTDLMWLGWGLAFLTKGPPGMLPLLAILVFVASVDGRRGLGRLVPAEGLLVFVLVGLGWYAVVIARQPELLWYFLGYELAARMFTDVHHRNAEWYGAIKAYLPMLLAGTLPWTPWLLKRRGLREPASARQRWWKRDFWRDLARRDRETFFLLLWLLLPLAVFCLVRSRLPFYILPLFAPISLLLARRLRQSSEGSRSRWARGLWVWIVALIVFKVVLARVDWKQDDRAFARAVRERITETPAEVVFAETSPRFGLGFYLGTDVEVVTFYDTDPHPLARLATGTLDRELAESAEDRLFVVQQAHSEDFERALGHLGYASQHRGRWHDLDLYTITPKTTEAPSGP